MLHTNLLRLKKILDKPFLVVGGISLFGALLRLYNLGLKPIWLDEAVLYWISNSGSAQNIISQNAFRNSAPPLFALLLHLVQKVGDSETALRLLPMLGGVAAIPALYFLARQFLERTSSYFVICVAAIAPTQIQYSQQLREYSLTFLMATVILALFFRQLRSLSWGNLVLMTLAMVLGVFLQYGLALLIIALNFIVFIELLSVKNNCKLLLMEWGISQLIVFFAVVAVYFLSLKEQMTVGFGSGYLVDAYWNGSIKSILTLALSNTREIFNFAFPGIGFLFFAVLGFIAALKTKHTHIALMMFVFPMALTFVAALGKLYPYQGSRQDMFLIPMVYVLLGFGINYMLDITQQRWVVFLLFFFTVTMGFKPAIDYLNHPGIENMRPVAAALTELFEKGDKVYVYYAAKPSFTYYYRDNLDSQIYGIKSRRKNDGYFHEIDDLLLANNRVWMVFSHCYADECEIIPKYVSEKRKIELVVSDLDAYLYIVH